MNEGANVTGVIARERGEQWATRTAGFIKLIRLDRFTRLGRLNRLAMPVTLARWSR